MLSQLFYRFYPSKHRQRIGVSGLDNSGKTTFVHKVKYGQVVETTPTMGLVFTTADLDIPTSKGTIRCTAWETATPGCSPRGLIATVKSMLVSSAAIIWLVDAKDHDRLEESVQELSRLMIDSPATSGSGKLPITVPILIIATKQDLAGCIPLTKIQIAFSKVTTEKGYKAAVFGVSLVENGVSSDLLAAFDWFRAAMKNGPLPQTVRSNSEASEAGLKNPPETVSSEESLETKLASWISRAETDSSPEDFLSQFHSITLPSWDHYTHIRLAYVILSTYGRQKGKNIIFDGIENYIKQSSQTRGRTFHVTMTYFWIQIVHFGISNMLQQGLSDQEPSETEKSTSADAHSISTAGSGTIGELSSSDSTSISTATLSPSSPQAEFARFLLLNPLVTQGNLWEEYYSREVIMSAEAKRGMVLPDKKPLPNLIIHTASTEK